MGWSWSKNFSWIIPAKPSEMPSADSICETILRRFSAMDDCPNDWPQDWELRGTPKLRRESTIYRLRSKGSRKTICIKMVKPGAPGTDDSASQYEALRFYHPRSDHEAGFTVPEPYGWVPEYQAIIMEWVKGRTFSSLLKREFFFNKSRRENLRRVAAWLRWFHTQSKMKSGTLASPRQLAGIIRVFAEVPGRGKAATAHDPAIREYLEVAKMSAGLLEGIEMERADLHGDFKPTNLIISSTGVITGIDFSRGKRGPVSHDICRFMSDLDFNRNLLGRSSALIPRPKFTDFDIFMAAYGGQPAEIARPAYVYLYFLTLLRSLVYQRKNFQKGAVQIIRMAVARRIAGQLATELAKGPEPGAASPARTPWHSVQVIPIGWLSLGWESEVVFSLLG